MSRTFFLFPLLIFLTTISSCIVVNAQSNNSNSIPKIELHSYGGALLIHRDAMSELGNYPYFGNDFQIGFQTTGTKAWHELFKYPSYGIGLYSGYFNNSAIGNPFALYAFMELPFLRHDKFTISGNLSVGMTFNINEYDSVSNKKNVAIGTDRNVYIDFSGYAKYKISPRFELGAGIKLQHFSNGAIKMPNLGLNMASGQIALTYYPWKTIDKFNSGFTPKPYKNYEFTTMLALGGKGKDEDGSDTKYMNSTFSFCASKRLNQKRNLGLGIDLFYNEYIKNELDINADEVPRSQLMSYAAFISSDLIANKFRMTVQLGTYIWRKTDYSIPIYERVALRYYINSKLFGNVSIKAHGVKAQFIEWGIGITI